MTSAFLGWLVALLAVIGLAAVGAVGSRRGRKLRARLAEAEAARDAARVEAVRGDFELGRLMAERVALEAELEQELDGAERILASGRELVANVSHELKTPLTAIRGAAETLRDGALEDPVAAARFTARILEQCERLEEVLRDLLILSRLEADGEARREEVDLERLARRSLRTLEPLARGADVRLEMTVEDPPPPRLEGDAGAFERLLLNLLENAIKYNRPGGEVRVVLRGAADGNDGAVIEVRDTGIGIPEGDRERIFERFYRVDRGRAREQGGSGLGLAIARRVIESHGGSIDVESRVGRGSTFRVHLPIPARPTQMRIGEVKEPSRAR